MHMANTAVFGIYQNRVQLEDAVNALHKVGFRNTDTSALYSENEGSKDFAHERHTKAPEYAISSAGLGAVVGGALGFLGAIGSVAIPVVGPLFVTAGAIMGLLAGVGIGGTTGAIIGALAGIGRPEYEAKRYDGRMKQGGILLSVHCDSPEWVKRAKDRLKETGAESIASAGESSSDFAKTDRPVRRHAEHLVIVKEIKADRAAAPEEASADLAKTDKIAERAGV
jgi:hypothetical protein